MDSWSAPNKDEIRSYVCRKPVEPYKRIILLPSDSCLDVYELLHNKAITTDTFIYAIERVAATAQVIEDRLRDAGFNNFYIFKGELYEAEPQGEFDFIYLDTCGQLSPKILNWFCTQVQRKTFAPQAQVYVAFCQFTRNGIHFKNKLSKGFPARLKVNPDYKGLDETLQRGQHCLMATALRFLGRRVESWVYRNSIKAQPMHVFRFEYQYDNTGMSKVLKVIESCREEPVILTPGLKAAATRKKNKDIKKVQLKEKKLQEKESAPKVIDIMKLIEEKFKELTEALSVKVVTPKGVKVKPPTKKVLKPKYSYSIESFAEKLGYSSAYVRNMCNEKPDKRLNGTPFKRKLPKGWAATKINKEWRIYKVK